MAEIPHQTNKGRAVTPEQLATTSASIASLSVELRYLKESTERLHSAVDKLGGQVDRLEQAADLGKGAWWMALKLGGFLMLVASSAAWVYEHLPTK
jgi:hypothetical protein